MKSNTYFIFIVFAILILSVSAVNAAEDLGSNDNLDSNLINTIDAVSQASTTVNKNWTVDEFLNNYNTIQDNDVVLIRNGTGTPTGNVVLSQKGITIFTEGNVIFDGKGQNMHFEITGSNVLIRGITFKNFNSNNGGAILWSGNDGTLTDCNFSNNTATEKGSGNGGGAIFWSGTNGALTDCNFSKNAATGGYGGAILWTGANGSLTSCTFKDNTANYSGGAIYWNGAKGTLTDSNFTGNVATSSNGGGIFWLGANGILSGCTFTGNTAKMYGGGIGWWNGINSILSGCTFTGNTANSQGGGIYWNADKGTLTSSNFVGNTATSMGGGVFWHGTNGNLTSSSFINNNANRGGGLYWWATNGRLSNSSFTGNVVKGSYGNGGGVYWWAANGILSDSSFTNNSAIGTSGYGGGVFWDGDKGHLTSSTFSGNTAKTNGGGVYWNDPNGILTDCTLTGNTANWGAGVWWGGANGILSGSTFISNKVKHNGGAIDWQGINGNITDSTFINNSALEGNGNGGAVYGDGRADKCSLSGCTFIGNIADNRGGGLTWHGVNFTLSNSTFIKNTANSIAGGLYWYGDDGLLIGCNFTNNTSPSGAGIYWNADNGRLTGCNFIGNVADIRGSAIYWYGVNGTLSDSTFISNVAKDNDRCGSGIYWQGANGTLTRSTFTDNTARGNGGAVYWSGTNGNLSDSNFTGNTVTNNNNGGAVWWGGSNGVLSGSTFTGNTARGYGGAVYWNGVNGLLNGCIFTGNTARGYGGAVSWNAAGSMINCSFINSKWTKSSSRSNGMYIQGNLNVNGGKGIVDIFNNGTLSGISIVVLNNETYFVSPNQFMNLTAIIMSGDLTIVDADNKLSFNVGGIAYSGNQVGIRESDGAYYIVNYRTPATVPQDITVSATYSKAGTAQYKKGTILVRPSLNKITLNVTSTDAVYGQPVVISAFLDKNDATGSIVAIINGINYNSEIVNGKAIFQISNLPVGVYTAYLSFPGDDKYMAATANTTFNILKATPVLDVNVANGTYGTDTTISVTTSAAVTGSITITIDGRTYTKKIVNGVVSFVISGLDAGSYNVNVKYSGDGNFTNATANAAFNVNKVDTLLNMAVNTSGNSATVTVITDSRATGNMIIKVGDKTETVAILNGKASATFTGLGVGFHIADVTYAGDDNFDAKTGSFNFTIDKLNPNMEIAVMTFDYGTKVKVTVTVNNKATGTVTISIDGNNGVTVDVVNGKAIYTFTDITDGNHTVTASYSGDGNFSEYSKSLEFSAGSEDASLNVIVGNIAYGSNATIVVITNPTATGTVDITVNGKTETVTLNGGKATLTVPELDAGIYTISAAYSGDANFSGSTKNTEFTVSKINAGMNIIVSNVTYGDNETVIVTVNPEATGTVDITVNGKTETLNIIKGKATLNVAGLNAGHYTVTATYFGNTNFDASTVNADFIVSKISADMKINVTTDGDSSRATVTVKVNPKATGTVTITIDVTDYIVSISNGKASFTAYYLDVGNHTVYVKYNGDINFIGENQTDKFIIEAIDSGLNVIVGNITYGDTATIVVTINPSATGKVNITVNGKTETLTPVNGVAKLNVAGLVAGKYTVTAKYAGDVKFANETVSTNFIVNKLDAGMNVLVENITYGDNETIIVTVGNKATGKITIAINGVAHEVDVVDGKAEYTVVNPTAGKYILTVSYTGDANFNTDNINTEFIVSKINPNMTVDVATVDKDGKATVTVTVNTEATGTVTITIDGKKYVDGIVDGKATLIVSDLAVGNYAVAVNYSGDVNFLDENTTANFAIRAVNPSLEVVVGNITYGNNATITVNANSAATGKVTITVNGQNYEVDMVNGQATLTVPGLAAGSYIVNVTYDGDANFTRANATANFTVTKTNPEMAVNVGNTTYGNNAIVFVTMDARGNGVVNITVNGKTYTQTIKNGLVTLPISGLGAGIYKVTVSYDGDGNFTSASAETEFVVSAINPGMNVVAGNTTYGNNATVTVTVNPAATGKVNITVNGATYEVGIVNGQATLVVSGLGTGKYAVDVKYAGDANFTGVNGTANLNVDRINPGMNVIVENTTYGNSTNVNVIVNPEATGFVTITVNGKTETATLVGGRINLAVSGLAAGRYIVNVKYLGDGNFNEATANIEFVVSKISPNMTVDVKTVDNGGRANVTVTVNTKATGTVIITINGTGYVAAINNGKAAVTVSDLAVGNYTVFVKYLGDTNFIGANETLNFTIGTVDPALNIVVGNITYGDNGTIVVTINQDATGPVTITVNGKTEILTPFNGITTLNVPGLAAGKYSVTVEYAGDAKFSKATTSANFTVSKLDTGMNVIVGNTTYGNNVTITVTVNPEATGKVNITINGNTYIVDIVNGKATYTMVKPTAGKYDVTVNYGGAVNFNNDTVDTEFIVSKINSNMTIGVTAVDNGGKATVNVTVNAEATGTVTITIDGKDYVIGIVDGKATLMVSDLAVGNYTATVKYAGDVNFIGDNATANFTIEAVDPTLNVVVGNITYGNTVTIVVTLNSGAMGKVSIKVNGANHEVDIVNGRAILVLSGLGAGKYDVTVTYDGDAKFTNSTVSAEFTVSKLDSAMNVGVGNIAYGENGTITVTVNSGATGKVIIAVNGVAHEVDIVGGKAVYAVVNPAAGKYNVTVTYDGDTNFNGAIFSTDLVVSKINPDMDVDIATDNFGGEATVNVTVNTKATGSVTITIDGTDYIVPIVNGKAVLNVNGLVEGIHTVTVNYEGDENFTESIITNDFAISNVNASLNVIVGNITYGNNVTIVVSTNDKATGTVTVTLNGKDYIETLVNGKATLSVSGLAAGDYTVTVKYDGDGNFNRSTIIKEFTVSKINPGMNVVAGNITYGNNATVFVTMDARGSGAVNITINGKTYTQTIKNGKVTLPISGLGAGIYKVTVSYDGDGNFTSANAEIEFTVSAVNPNINIVTGNVNYGANATVTVTANIGVTGKVIIAVNGANHEVDIVNGRATLVLSGLAAGRYGVTVSYSGNGNFTGATAGTEFNVTKINPNMNVDVVTDDFGGKANVTVTVNPEATGKVNITVNSDIYEANLVDGKAVLALSDLAPGKYTVAVKYDGDGNFTGATVNTEFTIGTVDPSLGVVVGNITYGNNATVVVNVNPGATGKVNITVNGKSHIVNIIDGRATLVLSDLGAGDYTVSVSYDGDGKFTGDSAETEFIVSAINPDMNIVVSNITYGNNAIVTVTLNSGATGKVNITVNGVDREVDIVNGKASFTVVNPVAGKYAVVVSYDGDRNFTGVTINTEFEVAQISPDMAVDVANITYGANATVTVTVNKQVTGKVNITINGVSHIVDILNGKATLSVSGLAAGDYTVTARYINGGNFANATVDTEFNVSKANPNMTVGVTTGDYGTKANVTVTLNNNATGSVTITVSGKGSQTVAIVDGKATWSISDLAEGSHTVTVTYDGDGNFTATSLTTEFSSGNGDASLSVVVGNVTYGNNVTVVISTNGKATGTVTINVNGIEQTKTLVNGKATFIVSGLAAGTYTITATYSGDANFTGSSEDAEFTVSKISAGMNVVAGNVTYGANGTVIVTVNPEATGKVTINVNGVDHEVDIVGGKAVYAAVNLPAGKYTVTVTYEGNANFTGTTINTEFIVNKSDAGMNVIVSNITYGNNATVIVTVNNKATGSVTINVNGNDHTATIINGKATFNVPDLAAGDYTVAIKYGGDGNFTGADISAEFTVSKLNADMNVIVSNITYGSDETITVTVNNKATGTVTIAVNGKDYTEAIVNGKATFNVSGLAAGNYTVAVSYSGDTNFNGTSTNLEFTVSKINPDMNVVLVNGTNGMNVTVSMNNQATGYVTINVSGKGSQTLNIVNGKANWNIGLLGEGTYTVTVTYDGDANFTSANANAEFVIGSADASIGVTVSNITYGSDATIVVTADSKATGTVTISVAGKEQTQTLVNGRATFTVSGLAAGDYSVTVSYSGGGNFTASTKEAEFTVNKANSGMNVAVSNITYGADGTVTVAVNPEATGKLNIKVNGVNHDVDIVNGKATYAIVNPAAGKYDVTVTYDGDGNFTGASMDAEFTVNKLAAGMTVVVSNITYGNEANVVVTTNGKATGSVSINVNGKDYIETLVNGKAALSISGLAASTYSVTVKYDGDGNFTGATMSNSFTVSKANPSLNVVGEVYGNSAIIVVTANNKATGTVTITATGKDPVVSSLVNGSAVLVLSGLTDGTYTVTVTYPGDGNFTGAVASNQFDIGTGDLGLTVSVSNIVYGNTATVNVNVNNKATGTVTITVQGRDPVTLAVVNGKATLNVPGLAPGTYTVTVTYNGDSNFTANTTSTTFTVSKADSSLDVAINSTDNNVTVTVTVDKKATGSVTIAVGDKSETVAIVDGKASATFTGLDAGQHNVTVTYPGDDNFDGKTFNTTLTIGKADPSLNIATNTSGNSATVTVTTENGATGSVTIAVGDKSETVAIVGGKASATFTGLDAGPHEVTVTYPGDENFNSATELANFTIDKVDPTLDIATNTSGNSATVTVNTNGATGNVTITVGDKTQTVPIVDGKASATFDNLAPGEHTVTVTYPGDNNFDAKTETATFTIDAGGKADPSLEVTVKPNDDTVITVTADKKVTGNVTISIPGVGSVVRPIVNGAASWTVSGLNGTYTVTVTYGGDDTFNGGKVSKEFVVTAGYVLSAGDVVKYFRNGTQYHAYLKTLYGNPVVGAKILVTFINSGGSSVQYTITTNAEGIATLVLNANPGRYSIVAEYGSQKVTSSITILALSYSLSADDIVMGYRDGTKYTAKVTYSNGSPVSNVVVLIIINKGGSKLAEYKVTTDKNGIASLPINLAIGQYTMTAKYQSEAVTTSLTVLSGSYRISTGDVVKYFKNGTQYNVKVTNLKGNPVVGEKVTVTIRNSAGNTISYVLTTNAQGIATMVINLLPGQYTVNAKVGNDNVQNKITVLPILTSENLVKSVNQPASLNAYLVDGKGNPNAGKNIEFIVNGKTYTKTTNSGGIASLPIGLAVGTYTITIADPVSGAKTTAKVTVTR